MSSRISDPHECSSERGDGDDQLAASLAALAGSVVRDAATTARLDDPVLGAFSAVAGLSHSLVVRHGTAAATALARILAASGVFQVLAEETIPLTATAAALMETNAGARLRAVDVPHDQRVTGSYRVDAVVIDEQSHHAWLVEVRRQAGSTTKRARQRLEHARLSAVGHLRPHRVAECSTIVIDLHGAEEGEGVVPRHKLDAFFGVPVQRHLDAFDSTYKDEAQTALLARLTDLAAIMLPAQEPTPADAPLPDDGAINGEQPDNASPSQPGGPPPRRRPLSPAEALSARRGLAGIASPGAARVGRAG
ncbi:MAG TPA: hypothetical protein ENH55_19730 [Aurantimonas coralicida]|nr:hypothetical protein [Aurantimonas coralicida]